MNSLKTLKIFNFYRLPAHPLAFIHLTWPAFTYYIVSVITPVNHTLYFSGRLCVAYNVGESDVCACITRQKHQSFPLINVTPSIEIHRFYEHDRSYINMLPGSFPYDIS